MADLAKEESAKELEHVIANSGIRFRSYSTLGLRDDADFMFWFAAETVEEIQEVISKIYLTIIGKYLIPSHVYLSATRPSIYAKTGKVPSFVAGEDSQRGPRRSLEGGAPCHRRLKPPKRPLVTKRRLRPTSVARPS
ncbi:MAG: chlorite dismutase family protein [Thaumarchaeota archaeon]|nr:chlorite dismutase family protein [Nitrososphaerota archaeon]